MRRVLLYGNSLVVSTVGASLQACEGLELVPVPAGAADTAERLSALAPAAVVFDLAAAQTDFTIALLRDRPELILIGVDSSSDKVLVLSGRQERPASAADLLQVLGAGVTGPDVSPAAAVLRGLDPTCDWVTPMPGQAAQPLSPGEIGEVARAG